MRASHIFQTPVIGDLLFYAVVFPFYWVALRLLTPPFLWLCGWRRIRCGSSVVWTPRSKKQAILNGIKTLQTHDPYMFLRLMEKQHLFIMYSGRVKVANALGHIFGLNERYIELGAEGVAIFFVQSLMLSEACPSANQFKSAPSEGAVLRKVLQWMSEHSFHPGLIRSYLKVVEKWEQKHQSEVSIDDA